MDEQAKQLQQATDELISLIEKGQSNIPLQIKNEDGTTNYTNVIRLLSDPSFEQYRKANPDVFAQAKINTGVEIGSRLLAMGTDIVKLATGVAQMKKGRNIDTSLGAFPKGPRKNPILERAASDAFRGSQEGMGVSQRASLDRKRERASESARRSVVNTGGSQALIQSATQGINRNEQEAITRQQADNEEQKRFNRNQLLNITSQQRQEEEGQARHRRAEFQMRTLPLFQERLAERRALMNAGQQNTFGAIDSIVNRGIKLGNIFKGDLPTQAFNNEVYGVPNTGDVDLSDLEASYQLGNRVRVGQSTADRIAPVSGFSADLSSAEDRLKRTLRDLRGF